MDAKTNEVKQMIDRLNQGAATTSLNPVEPPVEAVEEPTQPSSTPAKTEEVKRGEQENDRVISIVEAELNRQYLFLDNLTKDYGIVNDEEEQINLEMADLEARREALIARKNHNMNRKNELDHQKQEAIARVKKYRDMITSEQIEQLERGVN